MDGKYLVKQFHQGIHIKKNHKFFKFHCYSSITLLLISEPNFRRLKKPSTKIKMLAQKNVLSDVDIKLKNISIFKGFYEKSSNWFFQRSVGFDLKRAQTSEHCSMPIQPRVIPSRKTHQPKPFFFFSKTGFSGYYFQMFKCKQEFIYIFSFGI